MHIWYRKISVYIVVFLMLSLEYSLRRAFGVISEFLSRSLNVDENALMIIPSMFLWAIGLSFLIGHKVDKKPKEWLMAGGILYAVGFLGASFALGFGSFRFFLFFMALAAMGSALLGLCLVSFLIRPYGFGTTWDLITVGLARTMTPVIFMGLTIVLFQKGFTVQAVFVAMAVGQLILLVVLLQLISNLQYKENPSPKIILHRWIMKVDFWRMVWIMIMFEVATLVIGARFVHLFATLGTSRSMANLMFLICFCGFALVGRFFWSWYGHSINSRQAISLGHGINALGLILMPLGFYQACLGLSLSGFGMASGAMNIQCYLGDRYGQEEIASRLSSLYAVQALIGGIITASWGLFFGLFRGYQGVFGLYAIMCVASALFFYLEKGIIWKNKLNGRDRIFCKEGQ